MRIAVFLALVVVFSGAAATILAEWLFPDRLLTGGGSTWTQLLLVYGLSGHMLAGYAAVLCGWRLQITWLEALGWLGLLVQLAAAVFAFINPDYAASAFGDAQTGPRLISLMLPRLLFFVALVLWAREMHHHGLALSAPMSLCFLGMLALFITYSVSDWSMPEAMKGTAAQTSLSHAALYGPLLLALPAFLIPRNSRARLMPTAWTAAAATTFCVAAIILAGLGFSGLQSGLATAEDTYHAGLREFAILGYATLALWLMALWSHRR